MKSASELLSAAYQKSPTDPLHRSAKALYQKAIRDENGVRYFINVYEWDPSALHATPLAKDTMRFSIEVQLYLKGKVDCVNINPSHDCNKKISDYEDFFASMWSLYSGIHVDG